STQTMCSARSYAASRPAKLPNCAKFWKARRKSRIGSELLGSLPKTRVLVLVADQMALHAGRRQLGASAADTAGADARPADLAGKAPVLDFRAAVHDHRQAGGFRLCGGLLVPHTELHPHDANAEAVLLRDSLAGHLERRLRVAEDVDDADRWRNFR